MTTARSSVAGNTIRILIVDDHPTVREGLSYRISSQPDMTVCGDAADLDQALRRIDELQPDVVIVDISLKDSDGLDLIKEIKSRHTQVRMLVHSMYDETIYADRCLHAGAMGYVNKESDPDEVIRAIRDVVDGQVHVSPAMTRRIIGRQLTNHQPQTDPVDTLTDRQLEIFRLIAKGRSVSQIADCLSISVNTVETHRENIKRKLGVRSVAELNRQAVLWVSQQ